MPDSLAVRSICCPLTDQLPMLPPSCGRRSQRAAPWVRVSVSVAGESKITKWPYDAGHAARRLKSAYDSATRNRRQVLCAMRRAAWLCLLICAGSAHAEDGYDLWLRYRPVEAPWAARYRSFATEVVADPGAQFAAQELLRGMAGLLSGTPSEARRVTRDGAIALRTPGARANPGVHPADLKGLGNEGYLIRSIEVNGHRATLIAANSNIGVLYGAFGFLRLVQTRQPLQALNLRELPHIPHRILNHWDNLDGTIERGYAGASIWDWQTLPGRLEPRYADYARACASIGINGAVLNNVNADALSLTPQYLEKAAALARVFRPFGVKVYLSARFTAPIEIGGLKSADPLDEAVRIWWRQKVEEIYRYIPDFGGFLVKANSEGQPGPQDYGRSHADGANMLADALADYQGIVMWRAFVYAGHQDEDRTRQAYDEFVPLDGQFAANVLLQVKNGPLDFQPREPGHPLFGAMPKTPMLLELQITKEYLGFATHLVYLGPLYEEALRFDTHAEGSGSSIAKSIDGMAGVSNIGAARNWTGSQFDQANWYAFGRLAWNPEISSRAIAEEWVRMTFSNDARFVAPTVAMMMGSREAAVDYMTPLGLAHLMAAGHHYGPGPWAGGGGRRARRLDAALLSSRGRRRHRCGSRRRRQQCGFPILTAARRAVRRSQAHAGKVLAVVSSFELGLHTGVRPHAVG